MSVQTSAEAALSAPPNLSFVVPGANENRWSDLLASLISTDPLPVAQLVGVPCDGVQREVVMPGLGKDRLDLLLTEGDSSVAAVEVKLLSDLGPNQLQRYTAAFPGLNSYRVLHLATLPVNLHGAPAWMGLTWEDVLSAYASSAHPWVAATAQAWLDQLSALVPFVDGGTVWNDVPDGAADMELSLRARVAWLSRQMDEWCTLDRDMVSSSGGGTWAIRLWSPATTSGHLVTAEVQEGMSAYEWRPDADRPYRDRLRGAVVLLGLRQDFVTTSAGFDWALLHHLFDEHVLDDAGQPRDGRNWHRTAPRPNDPTDKANYQAIVAAGAPKWLGKGWGMKVAQSGHSCVFGARYQLPPTATLAEIDAELRTLEPLIRKMANHSGD